MLAEAAAAATATRNDVLAALKQASAATGSDFSYLLCTAMRESSLRPHAKASTSSACGLFQFVEQTWLGLVKQYGAKHGLASFANAIARHSNGRFEADNSGDRHAILALRNDPRISALMAGEYANQTRSILEQSLGRDVSNGELYAAHFLGPEGACRLIRMNASQPHCAAATAFPEASAANRAVFFHADGTPKSVREVYGWALKQPSTAHMPIETELLAQNSTGALRGKYDVPAPESDNWAATQLWAATQPDPLSGQGANILPQSPFAATPDILDLLGSLGGREKTS